MFVSFRLWTLLGLLYGVYGDSPVVAPAVTPTFNPYYANRNPAAYSPYYNPASATAPILTYSSNLENIGTDGSYSFSYTTGDGKHAEEAGFLKDAYIDNKGEPQGTQVKEGNFGYTSPEGTPIQVNYVADENGFRPAPIHIPADGKGVLPGTFIDGFKGSQVYDPRYNPYNPYNRKGIFGQYDPSRPYDPRYSYDQRYNPYNPYRVGAFSNIAKKEVKQSA